MVFDTVEFVIIGGGWTTWTSDDGLKNWTNNCRSCRQTKSVNHPNPYSSNLSNLKILNCKHFLIHCLHLSSPRDTVHPKFSKNSRLSSDFSLNIPDLHHPNGINPLSLFIRESFVEYQHYLTTTSQEWFMAKLLLCMWSNSLGLSKLSLLLLRLNSII